jgi:riboflavin biosynthesis pyrimidine reductase
VILRPVYPSPGTPVDLATAGWREELLELYRPPRADWIRINLVGSVSGSAAGADGTSETLTNPADRKLLGVIRSLADVVVVGAASVRSEGYYIPRHAELAVVTGTGDLGNHLVTSTGAQASFFVLCPESAVARARETTADVDARILVVPDEGGSMTVPAIVDALHGAGFESIVCEGGPTLASQFVRAEVVDEVCLTTSPILNGASAPLFGGHEFPDQNLRLVSLLVDDANGIYARWGLDRTKAGG